MSWVKLDDTFTDHPKVVEAGPSAAWLYVAGLCYCARHLTDGRIPASAVRRLTDFEQPETLVQRLLAVGLWEQRDDGGYAVHDYLDYNPSAAGVQAERARARQRKARRADSRRGSASARPDAQRGSPSVHPDTAATIADVRPTSGSFPAPPSSSSSSSSYPVPAASRPGQGIAVAAAAAPSPQYEDARANSLVELVDAFRALGLPEPILPPAESRAALELLRWFEPVELAECWQDHAAGDYGDDFARRELSFAYLLKHNRADNWRLRRAGGIPSRGGRFLEGKYGHLVQH